MKVIGVDPAPKKAATLFDGTTWESVPAHKLPAKVAELAAGEVGGIILCWDAPLTSGKVGVDGCFYERRIERFFQTAPEYTTPKGISVRSYVGCPHWAVTQASLGFPRLTTPRSSSEESVFTLCSEGTAPEKAGNFVVEVHPAVAIWLWCRASHSNGPWEYKKDLSVLTTLWSLVKAIAAADKPPRDPNNDDEFDAYVAYLLGKRWLEKSGVVLLGNADSGSFLLPYSDALKNAFDKFTADGGK